MDARTARATYASPTVEDALNAWDEIEAEHDAGLHADAVVVDCPICVAEWNALTKAN